jgi:hypothetical protein
VYVSRRPMANRPSWPISSSARTGAMPSPARAGLALEELGVPIDVLWMCLSKRAGDPEQLLGFFRRGKLLVLIDRDAYYQAGFVIPKGGSEAIKARGLRALHEEIVPRHPAQPRRRLGKVHRVNSRRQEKPQAPRAILRWR